MPRRDKLSVQLLETLVVLGSGARGKEICSQLKINQPSLSKRMARLREFGLIQSEGWGHSLTVKGRKALGAAELVVRLTEGIQGELDRELGMRARVGVAVEAEASWALQGLAQLADELRIEFVSSSLLCDPMTAQTFDVLVGTPRMGHWEDCSVMTDRSVYFVCPTNIGRNWASLIAGEYSSRDLILPPLSSVTHLNLKSEDWYEGLAGRRWSSDFAAEVLATECAVAGFFLSLEPPQGYQHKKVCPAKLPVYLRSGARRRRGVEDLLQRLAFQ